MICKIKDKFASIIVAGEEVDGENEELRIDEGDKISFITDAGEQKVGFVTKIAGTKSDRKLQMLCEDSECEELWSLNVMQEGTLKIEN